MSLSLVVVLLISALAMTVSSSTGAVLDREVGNRAQTASVDPNSLTLTASPTSGYVGYNITFYANGSSYNPAANLTFTIFYDYYLLDYSPNPESAVTVNTTTSPGFVIQKHVYSQLGNFSDGAGNYFFWVALFVDDGESNESIFLPVYVSVYVPPVNTPPWLKDGYLFIPAAKYGEPVTMQALVQDNQSADIVTMFWDFGDGTNATNVSVAYPSVMFTQTHTWRPPIIGDGLYNATINMSLSLTDSLHPPVNYTRVVSIWIPVYISPTVQLTPPNSAHENKSVVFVTNASSYFGDPLTWTFNYSDGHVDVFHTGRTAPGELVWQNATHAFETPGRYTVNVSVTDAPLPEYQVGAHNETISINLIVDANSPPTIFPIYISPGAPRINESIGYVNVTFTTQAYDPDGDVLTLTWDFGEGDTRINVSSGGSDLTTYIQVVKFARTGNFTISLTATDGIPGHTVQVTSYANITSDNHAPDLLLFDKGPTILRDGPMPNETVNITIILTDREHDPLEVILDFGDGSPLMVWTNLTDYVDGNITLLVTHAYAEKGEYTAVLTVTDNKIGRYNHTQTSILPISVVVPRVVVHDDWDWWDYTSLGLFLMIPVLIVAWTLENRKRRRQIENQGMTYDEWKLMKEVKLKELDK
jgi:PKD repeat protein